MAPHWLLCLLLQVLRDLSALHPSSLTFHEEGGTSLSGPHQPRAFTLGTPSLLPMQEAAHNFLEASFFRRALTDISLASPNLWFQPSVFSSFDIDTYISHPQTEASSVTGTALYP